MIKRFSILVATACFIFAVAAVGGIAILTIELDDAQRQAARERVAATQQASRQAGEIDRLNRGFFQHYLVEIDLSEDPFEDVVIRISESLRPFAELYLFEGANDFRPMPRGWYERVGGREAVLGFGQTYGSLRVRLAGATKLVNPHNLVEAIVPEGVAYRLSIKEVAY